MSKDLVALNRRARRDYAVEETFEVGLVLVGSEVKSLRSGRAGLNRAYIAEVKGELFLQGADIPRYGASDARNHEPGRLRKVLVRKRLRSRLLGQLRQKGYSLVPLDIHFNARGFAKALVGLGKGRRAVDKRQAIKSREWERRKARILSGHRSA